MKLFLSGILFLTFISVQAGQKPVTYQFEKIIGKLKLKTPDNKIDKEMLGLKQKEYFSVTDIKPGILIIEIMNMYCPYCQKHAPEVNKLYRNISANSGYSSKISFMAIAVTNSKMEIDIYKNRFKTLFPIIEDSDYRISDSLKGLKTPHFMAMVIDGKGGFKVIYSKKGGFVKAEDFLSEILKLSGLSFEE